MKAQAEDSTLPRREGAKPQGGPLARGLLSALRGLGRLRNCSPGTDTPPPYGTQHTKPGRCPHSLYLWADTVRASAVSRTSGHLHPHSPGVLSKSDEWPGAQEPQARLAPALCPCRPLSWESRVPSVQGHPWDVSGAITALLGLLLMGLEPLGPSSLGCLYPRLLQALAVLWRRETRNT